MVRNQRRSTTGRGDPELRDFKTLFTGNKRHSSAFRADAPGSHAIRSTSMPRTS
jgi:hypothetical protein